MDKQTIDDHFRGDYLKFYHHYLPDVESNADEASALCPFHDDHTPSLSINTKMGLFICYGCGVSGSIFDFYAKKHNMILPGDFSRVLAGIAKDFNISNGNGNKQTMKSTVTQRYNYQDEDGNIVYQIERLEPKSFRIRQPEGQGWAYNAKGVKILPYHLPEIIQTDEVLIVEGEKDADNLISLGFTATTNPFGAGKWPDHFAPYFTGKHIVLLPDNDEPGRLHMQKVTANLKDHAASIRWLSLPDLPEKGDVSDWITKYPNQIEAGERLAVMIEGATAYHREDPEEISQEDKQRRGFHFRSASDLCAKPTVTNWLIKGILSADSFADLFGESGSMKTFHALGMAFSISTLSDWHGHEVRQNGAVYYIAGEGISGINRRIKALSIHHGVDLESVPLFVSNRAAQFLDDPDQVIMAVDELKELTGEDPVLVIIDTLSRNFGSGDENQTKDMSRFVATIDDLRSYYHCAALAVHHTGLSEKDRARGAYALKAALDWEYRLNKKTDGTLILTCTKAKDHEEPSSICFKPKIITLDGWIDPDDGDVMTSLVMVRTDTSSTDTRPLSLSGPRKIALDALISIREEKVHVDTWREAAFISNISTKPSYDTKKRAFNRALIDLQANGYVDTDGNKLWWVKRDTGQNRDNVGTCPAT